jgi:hypothetical protein
MNSEWSFSAKRSFTYFLKWQNSELFDSEEPFRGFGVRLQS